ncbi:type II toxin-antitoxin system RelE/ParE family toxin [bacterium]|nr:MAG: type II toxin-antitoxin system RelE/ParE family toxin [bacterium]
MAYRVDIAKAAQSDVREYESYIAFRESSPDPALKWVVGLQSMLDQIGAMPTSFRRTTRPLTSRYRQARYASHRIIFRIDAESQVVTVVRIYHMSRRSPRMRDLHDG